MGLQTPRQRDFCRVYAADSLAVETKYISGFWIGVGYFDVVGKKRKNLNRQ
jgi:hypothetical protein